MKSEDVAWFAGLFEGEGSLSRCTGRNAWRLSLRMTDEDVVRRIHTLFGGAVYDDRKDIASGHRYKRAWQWQEGKRDRIHAIVAAIYPFMGVRRRAKMDEFLAYYAQPVVSHSDRLTKNWENPEYRARMCAERSARWADPEWRAKQLVHLKHARGCQERFRSATVS